MSLPNALWQHVHHLDLIGFNPSPIALAGRIWASSRLKNGSHITELHPETLEPISKSRPLHPCVEDLRAVPDTDPPLLHGCIYGPPTVQVLLTLDPTAPVPRPWTSPQVLRIQGARTPERPKPQKNWLIFRPWQGQPQLWYHAQPVVIAENVGYPNPWTVARRHPWPAPRWAAALNAEIRLSTAPLQIPGRQTLWLWHLKDQASGYWSGANLSELDPPFRPTHTTAAPLFTPDDADGYSPHWPPNRCIFPMQCQLLADSTLRVWAGDSDRHSLAIETPLQKILDLMEPIRRYAA
jgi:hypothetical protein